MKLFRRNPFDLLLKKAKRDNKKRFLVLWNRGLGDVPLGLYALSVRIRTYIPDAEITFLTRDDLFEVFTMLDQVQVLRASRWKRGEPWDLDSDLNEHHLKRDDFDVILEKPDPTRWLSWQLGTLIPKLKWNPNWNAYVDRFNIEKTPLTIGVHVQTETGVYYGYDKNWPQDCWNDLFERLSTRAQILLFGMNPKPHYSQKNIIDLRGKTNLFEMLSLIKNCCTHLLAPDSGVLSVVYYVNEEYPLRVVSLWADPRQGILRQKVPSPNSRLTHIPLIGKDDKIAAISVDEVQNALLGERCGT